MEALKKTWILIFLLGCGVSNDRQQLPANRNFIVWDATLYQNKPDLQKYGLQSLTALYASSLWSGSDWTNPPSPQHVSSLLQQSPGTVFIDIENWDTDNAGIQKYLETIQSFQEFAPDLKFGYYGVSPIRDYWDAISDPDSSKYKAWQARNDAVAPIAVQSNIIFPSIYTFYPDQSGWKKYAIAQISEARRIAPGKPVYAFIWPRYENNGAFGDYMPADYWKMELETLRQYADGVVIWGGWKENWDDNAPWWVETKNFLDEIRHPNSI